MKWMFLVLLIISAVLNTVSSEERLLTFDEITQLIENEEFVIAKESATRLVESYRTKGDTASLDYADALLLVVRVNEMLIDELQYTVTLIDEILRIRTEHLGQNHLQVGIAYYYRGLIQHELGNYPACATSTEQAIKIYPSDSFDMAQAYGLLGSCLQGSGESTLGLEAKTKSLEIAEQILPLESSQRIQFIQGYLFMLGKAGKISLQLEEYARYERALEDIVDPEYNRLATFQSNYSAALSRAGFTLKAIELSEAAIANTILAYGVDSPRLSVTHSNLAGIYYRIGQYEKAHSHNVRAFELFDNSARRNNSRIRAILSAAVGKTQSMLGQFQLAQESFDTALSLYRSTKKPNQTRIASVLRFSALNSLLSGDFEQALSTIKQVTNLLEINELAVNDDPQRLSLFAQKALVEYYAGDKGSASRTAQLAMINDISISDDIVDANILFYAIQFATGVGDSLEPKDLTLLNKINEGIEARFRRALRSNFAFGLGGSELKNAINITLETLASRNVPLEAPYTLNLMQLSAVLDSDMGILRHRYNNVVAKGSESVKRYLSIAEQKTRYENISWRSRLRGDIAKTNELQSQIKALDMQLEQLEAQLSKHELTFISSIDSLLIDQSQVRSSLNPNETLVMFNVGDINTVVYAFNQYGTTAAVTKTNRLQLTSHNKAILDSVTPTFSDSGLALLPEFDYESSYVVYRELFKPIESHLKQASILFISGNRLMRTLPFNLLVTSYDGALSETSWLYEDYSVSEIPLPVALVSRPKNGSAMFDKFIGIGSPISTSDTLAALRSANSLSEQLSVEYLQALPALETAEKELNNVANSLSRTHTVLTGKKATKSAFYGQPIQSADVLMFSTHALFSEDSLGLVEPSLVLTTGETYESSVLNYSDIVDLQLSAQWVFLVACSTSMSPRDLQNHAGVSLSDAFLTAGAKGVLSTKWDIDSSASTALMGYLSQVYMQEQKLDPQTLSKAIGLFKNNESSLYSHPFYWGAFSVSGTF